MENLCVILLVVIALLYVIRRIRATLVQGDEEPKCSKCAANKIAKAPPRSFLPKP